MQKKLFLIILLISYASILFAQDTQTKNTGIKITIQFNKQTGMASNQYAIWVENENGKYIKTIYVTRFTAKTGWKTRPDSLPEWTKKSGIGNKTAGIIDVISGATPVTGEINYLWDYTDENNQKIADGKYIIRIEGSTRWSNRIEYFITVEMNGKIKIDFTATGDNEKEKDMIKLINVLPVK